MLKLLGRRDSIQSKEKNLSRAWQSIQITLFKRKLDAQQNRRISKINKAIYFYSLWFANYRKKKHVLLDSTFYYADRSLYGKRPMNFSESFLKCLRSLTILLGGWRIGKCKPEYPRWLRATQKQNHRTRDDSAQITTGDIITLCITTNILSKNALSCLHASI